MKNIALVKPQKDVKIILLGRSGSGKTRFFQYAIGNPVTETSTTVSFSEYSYNMWYNYTLSFCSKLEHKMSLYIKFL